MTDFLTILAFSIVLLLAAAGMMYVHLRTWTSARERTSTPQSSTTSAGNSAAECRPVPCSPYWPSRSRWAMP